MLLILYYAHKKKPLPASRLITVFILNLNFSVRPLSTPLLAADNNYSADEYKNKANKVSNGDNVVHGRLSNLNLCYCVAG